MAPKTLHEMREIIKKNPDMDEETLAQLKDMKQPTSGEIALELVTHPPSIDEIKKARELMTNEKPLANTVDESGKAFSELQDTIKHPPQIPNAFIIYPTLMAILTKAVSELDGNVEKGKKWINTKLDIANVNADKELKDVTKASLSGGGYIFFTEEECSF